MKPQPRLTYQELFPSAYRFGEREAQEFIRNIQVRTVPGMPDSVAEEEDAIAAAEMEIRSRYEKLGLPLKTRATPNSARSPVNGGALNEEPTTEAKMKLNDAERKNMSNTTREQPVGAAWELLKNKWRWKNCRRRKAWDYEWLTWFYKGVAHGIETTIEAERGRAAAVESAEGEQEHPPHHQAGMNAVGGRGAGGVISKASRDASLAEMRDQSDWIPGHERPSPYGYHIQKAMDRERGRLTRALESLALCAEAALETMDHGSDRYDLAVSAENARDALREVGAAVGERDGASERNGAQGYIDKLTDRLGETL